jgi:hypothetical protein
LRRGENFRLRRGRGWQDRPGGGDLPARCHCHTPLCVGPAHGASELAGPAAGASSPGEKSAAPAPLAPPETPRPCPQTHTHRGTGGVGISWGGALPPQPPSPLLCPAGHLPGSPGETPSWRPRGPGAPQLCSVNGARGGEHLPYTSARKSQSNADFHRRASFVLPSRAITTADGGSEEMEEELGPGAGAAAKPPAAPCALRGGGGGGGGGGGRGRERGRGRGREGEGRGEGPSPPARSRRRARARSPHAPRPSRRQGQYRACRRHAKWGPANAGLRPCAALASRCPTRQTTEREPAPAPIREIGHPLARLPRRPPRAPLDFPSLGLPSPRLEPEERGSANRWASA